VLCNAFTELAQGAIAFPVDRAACASRCAGGYSLQGAALYREFPCFFVYVLYEIAKFIPLFALYSVQGVTGKEYAYAYLRDAVD